MQPRAWNSSRRRRAISSSADSGHSTPSWPSSDGVPRAASAPDTAPGDSINGPPETAAAGDSMNGELGQVPGTEGALRDEVGDVGSHLEGVDPREELPLSSAT